MSSTASTWLTTTRHTLEMIRFSHTVFALPFALLAAVMAWCSPHENYPDAAFRWQQLVGILVCMVGARSAAMAFNRLADRRIDALNPRTAKRHLPAGILTVSGVIAFTVFSILVFLGGTLLFLPNWLPLYLAVPVLLFLCGYSLAKRFTSLAHFWLGAALMLAPLSAWIAIRGSVLLDHPANILPAVALAAGVLLWVSGFDIIYACQDAAFDREAGLYSVPARLGVKNALRVAAVCHAGTLMALALVPFVARDLSLGMLYAAGVVGIGLLLIYEHALVKPNDLARVNVAFFNVNAIVSIGLFLVATLDLLT